MNLVFNDILMISFVTYQIIKFMQLYTVKCLCFLCIIKYNASGMTGLNIFALKDSFFCFSDREKINVNCLTACVIWLSFLLKT